ncbi:MAG: hypothetical protein AAF447_11405 [Myxococcota bacterium]
MTPAQASLRAALGRVHSRPREVRATHLRLLRTRAPGAYRARDAAATPLVGEGWQAPVPPALRDRPAPRGRGQTLPAPEETLPRSLRRKVPSLRGDTLRLERRRRRFLVARSWRRVAWVDAETGAPFGVVPVVPRSLAAIVAAATAVASGVAVGHSLLRADVTLFWLSATLAFVGVGGSGAVVWRMLRPPLPWEVEVPGS